MISSVHSSYFRCMARHILGVPKGPWSVSCFISPVSIFLLEHELGYCDVGFFIHVQNQSSPLASMCRLIFSLVCTALVWTSGQCPRYVFHYLISTRCAYTYMDYFLTNEWYHEGDLFFCSQIVFCTYQSKISIYSGDEWSLGCTPEWSLEYNQHTG